MAKKIMGIDHGHGECAAYIFKVGDGNDVPEALTLNQDKDKVIPSAISYRTNSGEANCAIGDKAIGRQDVTCYFKTAPGLWEDASGSPRMVNGHSVKQLMGDFMGQLYRQIWRYNLDVSLFDGDEIELYVGCPSSGTWTNAAERESYEALISEATGLNRAYVHVVEESTAAVFNSFIGKSAWISANNGVLVFDFGSSTADSTYIQTAKMMHVNSWTLGASEIERGMLRMLLEQNDLTEKDIYPDDLFNVLLTMRMFKERYYSGTFGAQVISVQVRLADSGGNLIPTTTKSGKMTYKTKILSPQNNVEDFMDEVTGYSKFPVTEEGQFKGNYTWEDGCRAFMEQMRDQLQANQSACAAIVLTGGASRMPFIRSIASQLFVGMKTILPNGEKKVLTEKDIYLEDVPSITVARGLCVIGQTDMMLPEIKQKLGTFIISNRKAVFDAQVIDAVAEQLANIIFDLALNEMKKITDTITAGALQERIKTTIEEALPRRAGSALTKALAAWCRETNEMIYQRVSEESKKLYKGLLPANAVTLPTPDPLSEQALNLGSSIGSIEINYQGILQKFLANAIGLVVGGIIAAVFGFIPLINFFMAGVAYGIVKEWIMNNPDYRISPDHIKNAVKDFSSKRDKQVSKFKSDIKSKLSESLSADDYVKGIPQMIDDMLDIVALKKFETVKMG